MQARTDIKLTAAEVGALWTTYMNDSLSSCVLKYFLAKVKDTEIRPNVEYALSTAQKHVKSISEIFSNEGYPTPQGFTDEDVNVDAPPLYNDNYYLFYLRSIATLGLTAYGIALPLMARQDMIDFFTESSYSSIELTRRVSDTLLSKGLFVRPPFITIPEKIDFIKKQNFLAGFLGNKRSLTAIEISLLFSNIQSNVTGKALLKGFAQVTDSAVIEEFMTRGTHIAHKHIEIFSSLLEAEDIPASTAWDTFVTDSKEPPFSDKLMLSHTNTIIATGLDSYAIASAVSMRHDLQADYLRLMAETSQYGMDAINIMIENGWMEQPPQVVNHDDLAKV